MSLTIDKHFALTSAILLKAERGTKTYLIKLIQKAFGDHMILSLDDFVDKMENFSAKDSDLRQVDVVYYILCIRLALTYRVA